MRLAWVKDSDSQMTLEINRIHNMPCTEMFTGLTEQAALIVADPPYGIGYKTSYKTVQAAKRHQIINRDRSFEPLRDEIEQFDDGTIDTSWISLAYNALKTGGAMYLFTRWDVLHLWHAAILEAGFKIAQCLVWDKCIWGAGDLSLYGSQTENILVCTKGKHHLRWSKREGNVWRVARGVMLVQDGGGKHPTQKPTRLMQKIITYSSDAGDLVLDPFTGSGAACIAAQRLHRRFIGTDISPTFAQAANEWLAEDRRTNAQTRMKPMFEAMP